MTRLQTADDHAATGPAEDDNVGLRLAVTVREQRRRRGWTIAQLADASGVSRAMISRIEGAQTSPTANLLGKLSGAFGLTLSQLIAHSERADRLVARRSEQPVWQDPISGYTRRALSPSSADPLELVEVDLPGGAEVAFPGSAYSFLHQQLWVLGGEITISLDTTSIDLHTGDCLTFSRSEAVRFINPSDDTPARYLIALVRFATPHAAAQPRPAEEFG